MINKINNFDKNNSKVSNSSFNKTDFENSLEKKIIDKHENNENNINIENKEEIKPKRSIALKKAQEKYYKKNKCEIVKSQTKYNLEYVKREWNCECGDKLTRAGTYHHLRSKRHHKRMENIKLGKDASYCEKNDRVNCECGGHYLQKNKHIHYKSKKHQKHIEEKNI